MIAHAIKAVQRRTRDDHFGAQASAPTLDKLPGQQRRHADGDVAASLKQGQRQGGFGGKSEQGPDQNVGPFLHAQASRHDQGGVANGEQQALDRDDGQEGQRPVDEEQDQPGAARRAETRRPTCTPQAGP